MIRRRIIAQVVATERAIHYGADHLQVRKSIALQTPNFTANLAHKKYSLDGSASPNPFDHKGLLHLKCCFCSNLR